MEQPSTQVKDFFDFKSIAGCIGSMLLTIVTQPNGWVSSLITGLTPVALITTIAYNILRFVLEIFDRKNKNKNGTH